MKIYICPVCKCKSTKLGIDFDFQKAETIRFFECVNGHTYSNKVHYLKATFDDLHRELAKKFFVHN